jgi:hypothetical protein
MAKGTKKLKGAKSALSIPELRRGFEHIEEYSRRLVDQLVHKKITRAAAVADYSKEWRRVFHRALPAASAEASIDFAMSAKPARHTKKRGQRGGAAPVEAVMGGQQPGIYAAPTLPGQVSPGGYTLYDQVPNWVQSGFNGVTWNDSHQVLCGIENSTPKLPADLGSNAVSASSMKGGGAQSRTPKGLKRTRKQRGGNASLALAFRPLEATNPTSVGYDAQMAWKGGPAPASPDTTDPAFAYRSASAVIPDIKNLGAIDRNMSADVSSV